MNAWLFMCFEVMNAGKVPVLKKREVDAECEERELRIQNLIDDERCYEAVRKLRWGSEVKCPHCEAKEIVKRGRDEQEAGRQRYECKGCGKRFDDLTNTVFAGHHQPLKVGMLFLFFLGLNLSTQQIAQELNLNQDDAQHMAEILRSGVVEKKLMRVLNNGDISINPFVMAAANMRAMTMATASMKCTSIRWKDFGHCCGRGLDRIGERLSCLPSSSC